MSEQSASVKQKTAPASSSGDQTVKKLNVPNPIIIIVAIILFSAIASYIIPAGTYTCVEDPNTGNMVVDPESFTYVEQSPVGLFDLFMSVSQGTQDSSTFLCVEIEYYCIWKFMKDGGIIFDIGSV